MIFAKIALGLLGLGVVVFVHELGHFLAARAVGIDVEAFSLGWGKPILKKKIGAVEYRLGMFPVGGYCAMKGESALREPAAAPEPGSYYAASPFKRIITAFAGPLFNLVFAALVFSIIWGIGFETPSMENRIVLVSDVSGQSADGVTYPANAAGLQTGDWILEIDGKPCENYRDVQQTIALNPDRNLPVTVRRNGELAFLTVRPEMDKTQGAGKIGIYFWTDPIVGKVAEGGAAEKAGLQPGDRILTLNGADFPYTAALYKIFGETESLPETVPVEWERNGVRMSGALDLSNSDAALSIGLEWQLPVYRTPRYSVFGALAKGGSETWTSFAASVRSLSFFFKGIDLTQAVSGPVRITYMLGDVAASGFSESAGVGIRSAFEFLAFISIALGVMNLLPLPILDGGLIILFIAEAIRRRPVPRRAIAAFQMAGAVIIGGLMLFALFGDILFLTRQ